MKGTKTLVFLKRFSRVALLGLLILPGCGFLSGNENQPGVNELQATEDSQQEAPATAQVEIEKLEPEKNADIEIVWEIPKESVDGFIIRFGLDPNQLDQEVKLDTPSIEKIADDERGEVYHYVLSRVPENKPVYITIAAYRGEEVSPVSELYEVQPDKSGS